MRRRVGRCRPEVPHRRRAAGAHAAAPDSLASLEDALQALSAAWYQLAADASPEIFARRIGRRARACRRPDVGDLADAQGFLPQVWSLLLGGLRERIELRPKRVRRDPEAHRRPGASRMGVRDTQARQHRRAHNDLEMYPASDVVAWPQI
jgi:hypothetical protein